MDLIIAAILRVMSVEIIVIALVIAIVVCPPSRDPAILWKERNEKRKKDKR